MSAERLEWAVLRRAARSPEAVALEYLGERRTYGALERASGRIAGGLREAGVREGDRVALWADRPLEAVELFLGTLRAGGCFVPLDPAAPPERVRRQLADAGAAVLATTRERLARLGGVAGVPPSPRIVIVEGSAEESGADAIPLAALDGAPAPSAGGAEALAMILYTSGSTGEPKGVMLSHENVWNFVGWARETFHVSPGDRVAGYAPLHFDLATFHLFATLGGGATLCPVPPEATRFPSSLAAFLAEREITIVYMVPTTLSLLVRLGGLRGEAVPRLRLVLFAGEVFPLPALRELAAALPGVEMHNLFGPTETNVCTACRVEARDLAPEAVEPVPIGPAVAGAEVLVLDAGGTPVTEPGREGEMWVAGPGVALGYWGREEETRARFVPDPRPGRAGRCYRTGDRVRADAEGRGWRFLGRGDEQLKVGGYRVEPEEVERCLLLHPPVAEAAVVGVPDRELGARLHAFVSPRPGAVLDLRALLRHCRERLPAYMVPRGAEVLDRLPRGSAGKVDRRGLRARALAEDAPPPTAAGIVG